MIIIVGLEKSKTFGIKLFDKFKVGDKVVFKDVDGQEYFCKVTRKLPLDFYEIEVRRGMIKGMRRGAHKGELRRG